MDHGGLMPQRKTLADTTELTDMVFFVLYTGFELSTLGSTSGDIDYPIFPINPIYRVSHGN